MKNIKYFIVLLISLFILSPNAFASVSNFEAKINMEPEITENQINIILGFRGEEVMAVSETITYDSSRIKLLDVVPIDNFTVTKGDETIDGKWHTINIVADSMFSFKETNYAILVFEVRDNFKIKKKDDIFLYNIEAAGPSKVKYRDRGFLMSLKRESKTEMYFELAAINDSTKFNYYFREYILWIIIFVAVVIILIVIIFTFIPTRRKEENRDKSISNQIKKENFEDEVKITSAGKVYEGEMSIQNQDTEVIDLSDAIIVSETKPFENNPSKEEIVEKIVEETPNNDFNIAFDPFNKIANENQIKKEAVVDIPQTKDEIKSENELQKPILVQEIESKEEEIETLDLSDEDGKKNNINSILILLLLSIVTFSFSLAYANEEDEETFRVDDIRDSIVGLLPFDKELDYNDDGKIDVLDLIETRNVINVNFENLLNVDPGFKEIHGQSPNIISSAIQKTSQAVIINTRTTTTRRSTTKRSTTSKNNTVKTTTNNNSTSSTTTTTKTTTTRVTTGEKSTYQIEVQAVNGNVSGESIKYVSSASTTFVVVPNNGYKYKSVSCTNGIKGSFLTSSNTLKVTSINNNTVCTVEFEPRNDIKVNVVVTNGTSSPTSKSVTFGGGASFTIKPKDSSGYMLSNVSCDNGTTYNVDGNILNVSNVTTDTKCNVIYDTNRFDVKIYMNGELVGSENILFNETYEGEFILPNGSATVKCTGSSASVSKLKVDSSFKYKITFKVKGNTVCNISY